MAPFISTAVLLLAALASFSLALILARLGLAAMFRILPTARPLVVSEAEPPLRVISGGRARSFVGATGRSPA